MTDPIRITSSVLPASTRVVGFRSNEGTSRPLEVEVFLLVRNAGGDDIDLSNAIGAKAKLVVDRAKDDLAPFVFTGVFATLEPLHDVNGCSIVRAVLLPRASLLGLSLPARIFTKLPDILKAVL